MQTAEYPHSAVAFPGVALAPIVASTFVLAVVTALSGPVLRHFDGAVIPWPVHGLAAAILLSSRPADRTKVALLIWLAIVVGATAHSGELARAIAGSAMLVFQTVVLAILHAKFTQGRHPLRGTISFLWMAPAMLAGTLLAALIGSTATNLVGVDSFPGYSAARWSIAAISSIATISPIFLAFTAPHQPRWRDSRTNSVEFAALATGYALALLNAFFEVGYGVLQIPPAVAAVPFLIWAGFRFGVRGYAMTSLMFVLAVVTSSSLGVGPFADILDPFIRGERGWTYVAALAGPTMIFPIALAERAAAESRARGASAQLAAIIESSGDLISAIDRDLIVIAANPAWIAEFARISGVTVEVGTPMDVALAPLTHDVDDSLRNWRRALSGDRFTVTREIGDPSRLREEYEISYSPVRDSRGEIVGASQVVRNVSERRRQAAATADQRRLEALGRLAGGVAHDFNNLMTAVIGYTGIISQTLPAQDARQLDLAEIEKAASRAGELTQQLLAFARRRVIDPKIVDIGELVGSFMRLISPLLGSTIKLTVRISSDLAAVRIDPVQFEQVLMNLAVNARDAMPSGGELIVEVSPTKFRETTGVRLSVRDTGLGMPPEVVARIWEPFYTTKPLGKGTGLGLATVHGLVHQVGGEIIVESAEGVGTVFHVLLPGATPE
jgi:signal transduction histidine kinase